MDVETGLRASRVRPYDRCASCCGGARRLGEAFLETVRERARVVAGGRRCNQRQSGSASVTVVCRPRRLTRAREAQFRRVSLVPWLPTMRSREGGSDG